MEFEYEEVAKIAAEAMDNYLMFDKLLQCEFIILPLQIFSYPDCTTLAIVHVHFYTVSS